MKLFFKKISALFFAIIVLTMLISFVSLYFLRYSSFYKSSFLVNDVTQDSFDYIILGASDGLTTLNTKVIDSILSVDGINLSMDDTTLSSHYLMLQHFLAEGKRTKYCILVSGVSGFDFEKNTISDNDYRFLMYNNRAYVSDYYKQFPDKRAKALYYSKWIPMLGMSYYNAELFYPSLVSIVNPKKRNRFDEKGNYTYPVINDDDKIISSFEDITIEFSNPFTEKIETLCKKNNIKLMCYIPPNESKKVIMNSSKYHIINHSNTLKNTKYFYDEIHVNALGREISSINFALDFNERTNNLK